MPRRKKNQEDPFVKQVDTIDDMEIDFEKNIHFQVRLIQQDLLLLGNIISKEDREFIKESLQNNIRTLEIMLIGKITNFGNDKYKKETEELANSFEKRIKILKKSDDTEKEEKIIDLQLEYLRKKFEILIRISQTEQSEIGLIDANALSKYFPEFYGKPGK